MQERTIKFPFPFIFLKGKVGVGRHRESPWWPTGDPSLQGASTQDLDLDASSWREGYKVEQSEICLREQQILRPVPSKRLNKNKIVDTADMIGTSE